MLSHCCLCRSVLRSLSPPPPMQRHLHGGPGPEARGSGRMHTLPTPYPRSQTPGLSARRTALATSRYFHHFCPENPLIWGPQDSAAQLSAYCRLPSDRRHSLSVLTLLGSRLGALFLLPSHLRWQTSGRWPHPRGPLGATWSLSSRLERVVTLGLRGWGSAAAERGSLWGPRARDGQHGHLRMRGAPCPPGRERVPSATEVCSHPYPPRVSALSVGVCGAPAEGQIPQCSSSPLLWCQK